jgi:hypothetical protein
MFPQPVDPAVVAQLLTADQREALDAYVAMVVHLDVARVEAGHRQADVAEAEQADVSAALSAAEVREGTAPRSLVPAAEADREAAVRYVAAVETVTARALTHLQDMMVPNQERLVRDAWAALDADNGRKPDVTRRLAAAVLWSLSVDHGPEAPDDELLAALDTPSPEQLRAEHDAAVSDALDSLGAQVASFMQPEAEQEPVA